MKPSVCFILYVVVAQVWLAAPCDVCGTAITVIIRGINIPAPTRSKSPSSKSAPSPASTAIASANAFAQALCALALHEFKAPPPQPSPADAASPPPPLPSVTISPLSSPSNTSDHTPATPAYEFLFSDHPLPASNEEGTHSPASFQLVLCFEMNSQSNIMRRRRRL